MTGQILVRLHHGAVQLGIEPRIIDGKRELVITVPIVPVVVKQVGGMFQHVVDVDEFLVLGKADRLDNLGSEQGRIAPGLVVILRVQEFVGLSIDQLTPQFLIVDRCDNAFSRNCDSVKTVFNCLSVRRDDFRRFRLCCPEFFQRFVEKGICRGLCLADPIPVLQPCFKHTPAAVTRHTVRMLIIHDQMPPRPFEIVMRIGFPPLCRSDRRQRLSLSQQPVCTELGCKKFGRTYRMLQPSARDFSTERRDIISIMLTNVVERLLKRAKRAECRGFPHIVPFLEEVSQLPVSRLVIVVVGS